MSYVVLCWSRNQYGPPAVNYVVILWNVNSTTFTYSRVNDTSGVSTGGGQQPAPVCVRLAPLVTGNVYQATVSGWSPVDGQGPETPVLQFTALSSGQIRCLVWCDGLQPAKGYNNTGLIVIWLTVVYYAVLIWQGLGIVWYRPFVNL